MAKEKWLYLSDDVYLKPQGNGYVACDVNHNVIPLTNGQRKMLTKLAYNPNQIVSAKSIYQYYTKNRAPEGTKCTSAVAKLKATLPTSIRESVKSAYGNGYKLVCMEKEVPVEEQEPPFWNGAELVTALQGDFCGFYLDPLGIRKVLGAYIHIKNMGTEESPQMMAYAALGLRNTQVLLDPKLADVFSGPVGTFAEAFQRYKRELSTNWKRCSLFSGPVSLDGTMAHIRLMKDGTPETWNIMLEMKDYFACARERTEEDDWYRGGMGVNLAYKSHRGTFCFRIGLVRRSFLKDHMIHDGEMRNRLKLLDDSKDAEWKALKISGHIDTVWYEWILHAEDAEKHRSVADMKESRK